MKKFRVFTVVGLAIVALAASLPALAQKSSDKLTNSQVRELIANAKTPADHTKLQKHFLAVAAEYDAQAVEHAADAEAYRKSPSFRESKGPGGPGTAVHCDRWAQNDRESAKEARELATAHQHMAESSK